MDGRRNSESRRRVRPKESAQVEIRYVVLHCTEVRQVGAWVDGCQILDSGDLTGLLHDLGNFESNRRGIEFEEVAAWVGKEMHGAAEEGKHEEW